MIELFSLQTLAFVSIALYLGFDFWDGKRVKDEREELIQLKSLELAHKVTIGTLSLLVIIHLFFAWLNVIYVIQAIILAALYTEVIGKIYYRNKL